MYFESQRIDKAALPDSFSLLQPICPNPLKRHLNRQNISRIIEMHLVDAGHSIVAVGCSEGMAVIYDVVLAAALIV